MMLPTLSRKLRRFWSLPRAERRDLYGAARALLRARVRVRRTPLGHLIRREGEGTTLPSPSVVESDRVGLAVNRVADHAPFDATCLIRALAIQSLLRERGFDPGQIKVGVRMSDGRFEAHAWVVQADRVVGDEPRRVARYTEVSDLAGVRF